MGIDLIENSELSAFDYSRLGSKNFADDMSFSYASGRGKRDRERDRQNIFKYWQIPIPKDKLNDCEWLKGQLVKINNALEVNLKKFTTKAGKEKFIDPLYEVIAQYKNAISDSKCEEKSEKKREEETKQELLQQIDAETKGGASDVIGELKGRPSSSGGEGVIGGMSKTMKYTLFGIGGLLVAVILIAAFKRKSATPVA
jgi:hypothetical protein